MQRGGDLRNDPLADEEAYHRAASIIQRAHRASISRRSLVSPATALATGVDTPSESLEVQRDDLADEVLDVDGEEGVGGGSDEERGSLEEEEKREIQEPSRAQLWWSMAGVSAIAGAGYLYKMTQAQSDRPLDEDDAVALAATQK